MLAPSVSWVALLVILLSCTHQSAGADLCQWGFGRSILVNNTLFFMGGNYTFQGGGTQSIVEQQLYSLNLSTSFPVNDLLKDTFLHATASSRTQYVGGGAFFTDPNRTKLYSMAGYPDNSSDGINSLNAYDIQYDNWSPVSPGNAPLNKLNRGQAMFATTESGLGFIAGGLDWIPGMVTFNASDPNNLSWVNTTNNVPYFWGPATEYVRFGNKGVLVAVGGYISFDNVEQRDMSAIQVYDMDSQQWFQVTATGDIPKPRSSFCSGLSSASDDSSFQMTIYGGYNHEFNGKQGAGPLNDVYVLTMPAFQWLKVTSQGPPNSNVTRSIRHLCNTYQDRQMIVLGGDQSDPAGNGVSGCNPQYPPLKLLDTSTFSWQTTFPIPNSTYEVPAQVYNIIGGSGSGAATLLAPSGGFNATIGNAAASTIFSKRVARSQTSSFEQTSQNSTNSTVDQSSGSAPSNTGAIVGGVLGGLALVGGVAALMFFLLRRRKARGVQSENGSSWQKAELPEQAQSPRLASQRPGGFQTFEVSGDDVEALKPKELATEPPDVTGKVRGENLVAGIPQSPVKQELHELS